MLVLGLTLGLRLGLTLGLTLGLALGLRLGLVVGLLGEADVGPTGPLQVVPLSAKSVGSGFEPFQAPLNPKLALPLVGMLPL